MAYERFLYVAKEVKGGLAVEKRFEYEGKVHFCLFEAEDLIAISHDYDKLVKFYSLLQKKIMFFLSFSAVKNEFFSFSYFCTKGVKKVRKISHIAEKVRKILIGKTTFLNIFRSLILLP